MFIQVFAKDGSELSAGMSPFAAPITIPIPVLARALIMAGSVPYNRTFSNAVVWSSFAVADGGGRLSASCP